MADNATLQSATLATLPAGTGIALRLVTHAGDANQAIQPVGIVGISGSEGSYTVTEICDNLGLLVQTKSVVLDLTLSLDTSAYADGDVLAEVQELASVVRASGGTATLMSIHVIDKDDQGENFDIVIADSTITLGSENSAVSISDADADNILGIVNVDTWDDLINSQASTIKNIGLLVEPASGTSLYVGAISRGAGTYTASGIVLRLGFIQD